MNEQQEERIEHFSGKYNFLSNFYPSPVAFEGLEFPTVEHAYQAAKTNDVRKRMEILDLPTAYKANRAGTRLGQPAHWFERNMALLETLLEQKFSRHPHLRERLLATGSSELINGTPSDRYFGMVWDTEQQGWVGENHLGRLLMKVRRDIYHVKSQQDSLAERERLLMAQRTRERRLLNIVANAAGEVHRTLGGPGLSADVYREALAVELTLLGQSIERDVMAMYTYKGVPLSIELHVSLLMEGLLVIECVNHSSRVQQLETDVLSYLRLMNLRQGIILNFGAKVMEDGLHQVINKISL